MLEAPVYDFWFFKPLDTARGRMPQMEKTGDFFDSWKTGKSPVVDAWPLMSSPGAVAGAVLLYLALVAVGPRAMRAHRPLSLATGMMYYNAAQVLLSCTICYKALNLNLFRDGILYAGCRYPSSTLNPQLLDVGWWYFFAKFIELLDTLFFILRKKNKQITFLHVYHHALMALYAWSYLKFAAGGQGAVLALLNSAVHVLMYTYYLLAGLGPRFQKYLWWKKYVTKMQLVQFVLMLTYCVWTHVTPRCQFADGFTYFICANVSIFLLLFLNFYSKSYTRTTKTPEQQVKEAFEKDKNGIVREPRNGLYKSGANKVPNETGDDKSYEMDLTYCKDKANSEVFIARRKIKAAYGSECEFDDVLKK